MKNDDESLNADQRWRTEHALTRVNARIAVAEAGAGRAPQGRRERRVVRAVVGWVTATAIAAAATVFWLHDRHRDSENDVRAVTTAVGERLSIHLSDSSVIWLGPATTLRYRLTDRVRDVILDGSADFRVTHDEHRPFVVYARNARATDLGTEFAVRAYSDDAAVFVSVQSGRVALSGAAAVDASLDLRAGDLGRVDSSGKLRVTHGADVAHRAAWVNGQLAFTDQSLREVTRELERWFDVHITVPDSALGGRRISAVYSDASLQSVLDALCVALDARRVQDGRTVTILPGR